MNQIKMIGVKTKKNNKDKLARYQKQARRGIKGLVLTWNDSDPFVETGNIANAGVSHRNPTQRLIVSEMWYRCQKWILHTEFTWSVKMDIVFQTETRGDKVDQYEFTVTCKLRSGDRSEALNQSMENALREAIEGNNAFPEGHKNKGVYIECRFVAEVIGV